MSRLAAIKEYAFLTALRAQGFPVPEPIAQSRHTLVMELVQALPLRQVSEVLDPEGLYAELLELILRLADYGLIHGDFNEFNILLREDETSSPQPSATPDSLTSPTTQKTQTPILIDFPQMVSIDHVNAEMYFARDVACIKRFFASRFHFTSDEPGPFFADARARARRRKCPRLDVEVEASGFSRKMARDLDKYMREVGGDEVGDADAEAEDSGIAGGSDSENDLSETNRPEEGDVLAEGSDNDNDINDMNRPGEGDGLADQREPVEDIPHNDIDPVSVKSSGCDAQGSDMNAMSQPLHPLYPDVSTLVDHLSGVSL